MVFFADLDPSARAHLRRALAAHHQWCRTNGVPFPAVFEPLLVSNGQDWTSRDGDEEIADAAGVPLAYRYDEAGEQLRVSEKTIRRLVEAGELRAVTIGGNNRRIPRDDLVEYLETLRTGSTRTS